jgi:hypothetical protein
MTYRIMSRTEYGLPAVVTNSNGTPRPPLRDAVYLTAHYTGNNVSYANRSTPDVIRQIQRVFAATKPFEYNAVIGQESDNLIYEYAGDFVAAHSAGENSTAYGVLFLLGVGEDPTALMIDKWRWLRDSLKARGIVRVNVDQRMHFQMPGAATACPGNIKQFWPQFLTPWVTDEGDDEVSKPENVYIAKPPVGAAGNPPWFVIERFGGAVRYAMAEDAGNAAIKQVVTNPEQYKWLYRTVVGVPFE